MGQPVVYLLPVSPHAAGVVAASGPGAMLGMAACPSPFPPTAGAPAVGAAAAGGGGGAGGAPPVQPAAAAQWWSPPPSSPYRRKQPRDERPMTNRNETSSFANEQHQLYDAHKRGKDRKLPSQTTLQPQHPIVRCCNEQTLGDYPHDGVLAEGLVFRPVLPPEATGSVREGALTDWAESSRGPPR